MTHRLDPERTRVVVETTPRGMFARLAHELRVEAQGARVETRPETYGEGELRVAFPVRAMRVVSSRGPGGAWGPPSERDREAVEQRIRDEVFAGVESVIVSARLDGARAALDVSTPRGSARRVCPVRVARDGASMRVEGEVRLSLAELHTGEPHVPFGAVRLDDSVLVRFDVTVHDDAAPPA